MSEFKFQLGEVLTHVAAPGKEKLLVLERISQECHGGLQRSYLCRGLPARGGIFSELIRFHEAELLLFPAIFAEDHLAVAKSWAVEHAYFDVAADIRDVQEKLKAVREAAAAKIAK